MDIYTGTDKSVDAADPSTQAMVRMWDGHTLVINVDSRLKTRLKVGNIVLVDYYPSGKFKAPVPKILVTKILRGDKARRIAAEYKAYYKRTRRMKPRQEGPAEQVHERSIG
jgi:hypothetical protein